MLPRFFVDGRYDEGETVELRGGDARKASIVLRLRSGDPVEVIDSGGAVFGALLDIRGAEVCARLERIVERPTESVLQVTLAQGLPKGQKMDFVVEKATELGAARILPFSGERTVVESPGASKVERWRRLARTASQQCGRTLLPEVEETIVWASLLARFVDYDAVLVAWELAERVPLREVLPNVLNGARRLLLIVGPEGGISHEEAQQAVAAGAHALSLGRRILRTETAGLVACTALLYAAGEL